jgi:hypothetical protein
MTRITIALAAVFLMIICLPATCFAQAQARFSFDGIATCTQPAMQNYPLHGEGTGKLSTDGTAALDVDSNVEGRQKYDGKLGGRIETPGGSATLNVRSRHSLRVVRDYPNNTLVIDLNVVGKACTVRVESRLKPGRKQYTFATQYGLAYCNRPVITKTTCEPF